jgi:hypothetical protein
VQLCALIKLQTLSLGSNLLSGNIPSGMCWMTDLQTLDLSKNSLAGSIPVDFGNLSNLLDLNLSGNKLAGAIPISMSAMNRLDPTNTDIGYNALYTSDAGLLAFLKNKDWDWAKTQTIAPTKLSAEVWSGTKVRISWKVIPYIQGSGGYEVCFSKASGGPYTLAGSTTNKTVTSYMVTGLDTDTKYYFVAKTFTDLHDANPNMVRSGNSSQVSVTTLNEAQLWKAGLSYKFNYCVVYDSKTWRCTFAHTAQADWYPGAPGIWYWALADYDGQWHSGIAYKVGEVVQYLGKYWQCIFAHTSQSDWYPGAPDFWFWKKI